jgi:drug/metabolite transporter (DMT)-like permease
MIFAVLFLGEKISPLAVVGGLMIAGGAIVMVVA